EPPLKTCEGRLKHGSILNGNIWLRRVSSQWKSTKLFHVSVLSDLCSDRERLPKWQVVTYQRFMPDRVEGVFSRPGA
ncbi:hypothetical protein, partial [Rhizobium sp. Root268]